jgi:hypothetical protein
MTSQPYTATRKRIVAVAPGARNEGILAGCAEGAA